MIESKEWNWNLVTGKNAEYWLEPSVEAYYLLARWQELNKKDFLDLGCGLGRHSILFAKNGFNTKAFDLSARAIERAQEYAEEQNVNIDFKIGDMLTLPYKDESFDSILCMNVISHTDTKGMGIIADELKRVLKEDGEAYFTLGSKETEDFMNEGWPLFDRNTRIRMDDGPERGIPHFYADYDLIKEIFQEFKIENIYQKEDFYKENEELKKSKHYHVLVKKK